MKFSYSFTDENKKFSCNLQCFQCKAQTKTGARCRRRVCVGLPYCYFHIEKLNLKILPSRIHGKGLFAFNRRESKNKILFKPQDFIIEYTGEKVSHRILDDRYGKNGLAVYSYSEGDVVIDAACKRSIASTINHSGTRSNCLTFLENGKFNIYATKNIKNHEEILLNYGEYFRDGDSTALKFKTK